MIYGPCSGPDAMGTSQNNAFTAALEGVVGSDDTSDIAPVSLPPVHVSLNHEGQALSDSRDGSSISRLNLLLVHISGVPLPEH